MHGNILTYFSLKEEPLAALGYQRTGKGWEEGEGQGGAAGALQLPPAGGVPGRRRLLLSGASFAGWNLRVLTALTNRQRVAPRAKERSEQLSE